MLREQSSELELVIDVNGLVQCPCGQHIKPKRNKNGANYAKKFKTLSPMNELILDQFAYSDWRDKPVTKKVYRNYFLNHLLETRGKEYSIDAFNARWAELVGMGFIDKVDQGNKSSPLMTTKSPEYLINWDFYKAFRKRLGLYT
jgi:hypothetical protein